MIDILKGLPLLVTSNVLSEVEGPAEHQVLENRKGDSELGPGHLSDHFLGGGRHVNLILAQMVGVQVMGSVGILPAEIRDEQKAVEGPANDVIDPSLRRECRVSSLVSQYPNSGHNGTLNKSVYGPHKDCNVPGHVGLEVQKRADGEQNRNDDQIDC